MSADAHDIQSEVRKYYAVFAALLVLSCVTVAVNRLHLSPSRAIGLALVIATVKASLVACVFMHLLSEKRFIYSVLAMTVVFFFALMLIPLGTGSDPLHGTEVSQYASVQAGGDAHAEATQETEVGH